MERTGDQPLQTVADVLNRWPGIVEDDIGQIADFLRYASDKDLHHIVEQIYNAPPTDFNRTSQVIIDMIRDARHSDYSDKDVDQWALETASESVFRNQRYEAEDAIESGDEQRAETAVQKLLTRWPVALRVEYADSPLFPQGRKIFIPVDLANGQTIDGPYGSEYVADCNGLDIELKSEIVSYVERRNKSGDKATQIAKLHAAVESSIIFDGEYHRQLRAAYGTKAANLLVLAEAYGKFENQAKDHDLSVAAVNVPRFTAVPVKLHDMYEAKDKRYEAYLEQIRHQALMVTDDDYRDPELFHPLVAIRSSAVYSEDGEEMSGAGIYDSVAVDPRDPEAFRDGVEKVFESVNSEKAQAYILEHGIDHESMGLIIQRYIEGVRKDSLTENFYGYIHSSDASGRLMEFSCNLGELIFDRSKVMQDLMIQPNDRIDVETFNRNTQLHTIPDHDRPISKINTHATRLAHMAGFAEKLFGRPIELEFIGEGSYHGPHVLQARPLPAIEPINLEVKFPSDIEPLAECRAVGTGDIIVTIREDGSNFEIGEIELDVHETDHEATARNMHKTNEKAVMLILTNDGYSGHLQTLAKERSQICLFPEPTRRLVDLEPHVWQHNRDKPVRRFRIVADGYKGAIYPIED